MNKPHATGNAADEEQVRAAKRKERQDRLRELEDMRRLLDVPEFRRFVWRYLGACGVFRTSMETNARIYYNEGRRDVGLSIMADVTDANPQAFVEMMLEAKKLES